LHWLVTAPVLLLLALLGLRALARFATFPGSSTPLPPPDDARARSLGISIVDYEAEDGQKLRGARVRTGRPDAPTVLYFHGNGESAALNVPLALELRDLGLDTFLAEYRGYGGVGGRATEAGVTLDAFAALAHLQKTNVPREKLVVVGRSLGSGVAVELARHGLVGSAVLVSPYTSIVDMARTLVGPLAPLVVADRFDSLSKVREVSVPMVVIHGRRDEVVPYEQGRRLAEVAGARLVTLEDRGHNDIPDLAGVLAREIAAIGAGRAMREDARR
jgi:fermentation-respiration switch protein FrsA (DUF1100 family)